MTTFATIEDAEKDLTSCGFQRVPDTDVPFVYRGESAHYWWKPANASLARLDPLRGKAWVRYVQSDGKMARAFAFVMTPRKRARRVVTRAKSN